MACPPNQVLTELGCLPTDPGGFTSALYSIGLGLVGGISLLAIIYGAYIILTSRGNPEGVRKGRSYIVYAIVGLFLAIFAALFFKVLAVDILHITGFS